MTRREYRELESLRAAPLGTSSAEIDRWCYLESRNEQAWQAEVYSQQRWERWRPALRTLADVLFWSCAVPFFVVMAISGVWVAGSVMIFMAWLGLRCDWTVWQWIRKGTPQEAQRHCEAQQRSQHRQHGRGRYDG
jgi:hypothetical protein